MVQGEREHIGGASYEPPFEPFGGMFYLLCVAFGPFPLELGWVGPCGCRQELSVSNCAGWCPQRAPGPFGPRAPAPPARHACARPGPADMMDGARAAAGQRQKNPIPFVNPPFFFPRIPPELKYNRRHSLPLLCTIKEVAGQLPYFNSVMN